MNNSTRRLKKVPHFIQYKSQTLLSCFLGAEYLITFMQVCFVSFSLTNQQPT